jgi:hypothetical protein
MPERAELFKLSPVDGLEAQEAPEPISNGQANHPGNSSGPADPLGPVGASAGSPPVDDDPFSPERLRLSQDFASAVGVRKLLTTVPVRKPSKEWWVRTHPDPAYRLQTAVLELKEDREVYLVAPPLWPELASEPTFSPRLLITAINRQNMLFVWPIRLPGPDRKVDEWSRSALDAADNARSAWTRVYADMALEAYRVEDAPSLRMEPTWPDLPMREILRVAFRDKMISTWDHPVLQRLRGEV